MPDANPGNLDQLIDRLRRGERSEGAIDALIATVESLRHHTEDASAVRRILQASEDVTRHALKTLEFHIDNSPLAVVEWNPHDGVLRWSAGATRMFGFEPSELVGANYAGDWRLVEPEDVPKVKPLYDQLLRGELPRFVCFNRIRRKDGKIIWCQVSNSALTAEDGSIISVLSQAVEMTERVEAEQRLREAQERLELHIDNSAVAIVEWSPEFTWLRWSSGAHRIFGYTADEAIGKSFVEWQFIHPLDVASVNSQIEQMLAGELPRFSAVNRNIRKDGTVIWCEWHSSALRDESGKVISVLSHAIDITDRITAEQELRSARQAIESHLDNSPLAIVEWGPDFIFRRWSRGAERIYGYTSEEMIGTSFETMDPPLIHPLDMPKAMAHVELLLSGRSMRDSIEARNFRKDGSIVWMQWHGSSLYDADGKLVSVLSQGIDISKRVAAEEKLRASEAEFRAAFELTLVGMTQVDPVTRRYLSVNEQFCAITGYSADELKQMDPFQLTHPDDLPKLVAQAERIRSGETDHYVDQRRCVRKDGSLIWLHVAATLLREEDGTPARIVSAAIDITENVKAEQKLRDSESEFRAAFELAIVGMVEVDARTGKFLRTNKKYCEIIGYSEAELLELTPRDITFEDDKEKEWNKVLAMLRGETSDYVSEKRCVRKDGSVMWIHVAGTVIKSSAGEPVRAIAAISEITNRKLAEQQLRAAKDRAEAASRAKDRFIASLSHELRTPLTPVRALLSVLRDDPRLPPDVREDLQMVHRNVLMESRLIDDLLDVTRLARGDVEIEFQRVDVHALVRQAVENAAAVPEATGLDIQADLSAVDAFVHADPQRMQQVLWNLMGNALKFTKPGGRVTVVSDNPDESTLRIRVTDTGVGIAAEHLPYIFEAFERGESEHRYEYTGLGLGLAIARSLTEKMHGTINAQSAGADQGAAFVLTFPLAGANNPPAALTGNKAASTPAGKTPRRSDAPAPAPTTADLNISVLLVEDHPATADILSRLLVRSGSAVMIARSMQEALDTARVQKFDLILSDIGLPGGTGHELLRTLRQEGVKTPAIAISGFGMSSDIAASKSAGFAEHLTKPIDFSQLREVVLNLCLAEV